VTFSVDDAHPVVPLADIDPSPCPVSFVYALLLVHRVLPSLQGLSLLSRLDPVDTPPTHP